MHCIDYSYLIYCNEIWGLIEITFIFYKEKSKRIMNHRK